MTDKLRECYRCGLPQPPDYRESLHLEDCDEHDEQTCIACHPDRNAPLAEMEGK